MPDSEVGSGDGRSTDRLIGELIAEIRALKHSENNTSTKVDAIGRQTALIPGLIDQLKDIKVEQEKQHFRIAILEADKNRREGAIGLVEWVGRHWPFTVLLTGLTAFIAWANGRLHP